jgi:RNA polymerase nonessential primary-like sigma factor
MATALISPHRTTSKRPTASNSDSLGSYLRDIGRIPRLMPEDEITLGHQVQQMMALVQIEQTQRQSLGKVPTLQQWADQANLSPDGAPLPEESLLQESIKQSVLHSLDSLTGQQREVMILRYGLLNNRALSLDQVGQRLGISQERVRQLQNAALGHLRRCHHELKAYVVS